MKRSTASDKPALLRTASAIAGQLRAQTTTGRRLKIRRSFEAIKTHTNGWAVTVGRLDGLQTGLEIWLDHYAGHESAKFSACFWSASADRIKELVHRAPKDWVIGQLSDADYEELKNGNYVLRRKLARKRFNQPIEEHYPENHFFGFYDYSAAVEHGVDAGFVHSAVAFFTEIVNGGIESEMPEDEAFPREENRKLVSAHLRRERSRFLAARCKQRDGYQCQVCRMTFANVYGDDLGACFAEAHHIRPLGSLGKHVKTRLEDLITVCPNCHRMLHRMEGKEGDLAKLRKIVSNRAGAVR
jgi:5-methylcytosine-specific restriction endonuclease McrA